MRLTFGEALLPLFCCVGKCESRIYRQNGLRFPDCEQAIFLSRILPRWRAFLLPESDWALQARRSKVLRCQHPARPSTPALDEHPL